MKWRELGEGPRGQLFSFVAISAPIKELGISSAKTFYFYNGYAQIEFLFELDSIK